MVEPVDTPLKILVTGATGYIGSAFTRKAIARGHEIVAASRRPSPLARFWLPYQMGDTLSVSDDIDAVVHLAADTGSNSSVSDIELRAVRSLMLGLNTQRVRFVFVSSQTSRPDAPTKYGRDKWIAEQHALTEGGVVVRPGQVYGGEERGLFGTLVSLTRRSMLLPAFMPPPFIQPIHVDDCSEGMLRIIERDALDRSVYTLAGTDPITFTSFLRTIAHVRLCRQVVFVPVPSSIVRVLAAVARRFGLSFDALERLTSLLAIPRVDSAPDMAALDLHLRPLAEGMTRSGTARRQLIEEGRALLSYVLRRSPTWNLITHYVRSVERVRNGKPLYLPHWLTARPCLIGLIDSPSILRNNEELRWRLDAAVSIAEASTIGFSRFMRHGTPSSKLSAIFGITRGLVVEAIWRAMRVIAHPVVVRLVRFLRVPTHV